MADEIDSPNHMTIVRFAWQTSTKGTERYQEINENGQPIKGDDQGIVIGTLYVRKAALDRIGKGVPKRLSLHIDK